MDLLRLLQLLFDWSDLRVEFGLDAVIYAGMALAGTALFVLRLGLMLILGIDGDLDLDADIGDIDHGGGFSIFSILSVTAFLMGAGWMGLVAKVDWGLEPTTSALSSGVFGIALMLMASSLLFWARKMTHEVPLDPTDAVGRVGTVYMQVPEKGAGTGQVRVTVQGQQMTLSAVSTGPALESFSDVKIVEARGDGVLVVEPLG